MAYTTLSYKSYLHVHINIPVGETQAEIQVAAGSAQLELLLKVSRDLTADSRDTRVSQFGCSMAEVKLSFEALKNDVSATQHCISELLPMVGPVHASSWRFPEISSSEVNTKKLLDKIAFTEDEEKFATTRTLLMELAIDRYKCYL